MNVTAIGRTRMLSNAIRELTAAGHTVERIVTAQGSTFYEATVDDFRRLAAELSVECVVPDDINAPDLVSTFRESSSQIAVSVNWPGLIERPVLDAFEHGVLNGHAGDLPRYRGNAAPNWALINGESEVVLTVHRMTERLDAGPILRQRTVPVTDDTYLQEIYEAMWTEFPDLFVEAVAGIEDGSLEPRPQPDDPAKALRGYPRVPKDSELDWTRSAEYLDRLVRASAEPLFGAFTYLDTEKLTVWRARAESPPHQYLGTPGQVAERRPESGDVAVVTGDDFLVLEEVEPEGGERVQAAEIISSVRTRLGMDKQATIRTLEDRVSELEERLDDGDTR